MLDKFKFPDSSRTLCKLAVGGLITTTLSSAIWAQTLDTRGTEFWLGFPQNHTVFGVEPSFFISSEEHATVTIEIPSLNYSETYFVDPFVASKVDLPNSVITSSYGIVTDNGVKVSADVDVTVYGLSRLQFTTDAFLGFPTDVIGTEYIALGWGGENAGANGPSQLLVVGSQNDTNVSIFNPHVEVEDSLIEFTLNAGEVYQFKQDDNSDISGAQIFSSSPVAVFAGHECANIPNDSTFYCDHVVEQLPPVSAWGRQFITAPLANRLNGDTFRIIASEDSTVISIDGSVVSTINRGEFYETQLENASLITTTEPVLLFQYSNGTTYDNVTSDPFEMMIPPFEQFLDSYTFAAPTEGFAENFANVVVKTSDAANLRLDDEFVDVNHFIAIEGTEYSYAQLPISLGSHTLDGALAGVFVYGYDDFDSYGYAGGLSLSQVALAENLLLDDEYKIQDGEACFNATVTDELGEVLSDIRVDFTIDDLQALFEEHGFTDQQGVAEVCIEAGENPDEYFVSAAIGGQSVSATVTEEDGEVVVENNGGGCTVGNSGSVDPILLSITLLALARINRKKLCSIFN